MEIKIIIGDLGPMTMISEEKESESEEKEKPKSKTDKKLDELELRLQNKADLSRSDLDEITGELLINIERMLNTGKNKEIKSFLHRMKHMLTEDQRDLIRDLVQSKYSKS